MFYFICHIYTGSLDTTRPITGPSQDILTPPITSISMHCVNRYDMYWNGDGSVKSVKLCQGGSIAKVGKTDFFPFVFMDSWYEFLQTSTQAKQNRKEGAEYGSLWAYYRVVRYNNKWVPSTSPWWVFRLIPRKDSFQWRLFLRQHVAFTYCMKHPQCAESPL